MGSFACDEIECAILEQSVEVLAFPLVMQYDVSLFFFF